MLMIHENINKLLFIKLINIDIIILSFKYILWREICIN